ncbi:MAG: biopolymer transporter ExbD [bacterium]
MADAPATPVESGPKKGLRRATRRAAPRIDMTPMVDVAFLLLIFFMLTTVFRKPLAMEINLPEPGAEVRIAESNVLTIFVDSHDRLWRRFAADPPQPESWDGLAPRLRGAAAANEQLVVLAEIHEAARYDSMVRMMDTLEDAGLQRFSLIRLRPENVPLVESLEAGP